MEHFLQIFKEAREKGEKAYFACVPTPQGFYSSDLSGKALSPVTVESEGDCGGACIVGIGGKDEIVRFYKKNAKFDGFQSYELKGCPQLTKGVYKGYDMRLTRPDGSQSAERMEALARAYAKVLNDNGIRCGVRAYLT